MKNKTKKTTEDIKKAVAEGKYPLNFINCYFEEEVDLDGVVFAGDINFSLAEFAGDVDFSLAEFAGDTVFFQTKFAGEARFSRAKFAGEARFSRAKFAGDANFNQAKFLNVVDFTYLTFGQEVRLNLNEAVFSGVTTFSHYDPERRIRKKQKAPVLKNLSMDHAIFEAPTIIDLPLKTCPDFSKSRFLKTVIIEETWTEKSIEDEFKEAKRGGGEPDESFKTLEGKFRFLKTYFAKSGNHFKEIEYFKYEMRAREGGLKAKKEVKGWCEHVRRRGEFVLFWLYKILSNYGTSVFRPLLGLASSLVLFTLVSYFSSLDGVSAAFAENFSRTIFPLSEFPLSELKNSSSVPSVWETIQALINVTFLFLLALGLRNKFKIK